MAVPSNPTVAQLLADAAVEAGQFTLTSVSTAVTNFQDAQFQDVKTILWQASTNDDLLEVDQLLLTTVGVSSLSLPSDYNNLVRLRLYDASQGNRVTLSTGYTGAVQLPSTYSFDPSALVGKYIFTLSGTGSAQYRSITTASDSTKYATVSTSWGTAPDSTTAVLISDFWNDLKQQDIQTGYVINGRPVRYRLFARTLELWPPSDYIYPVIATYGANLTRLDETSTAFIRHLRELRALWVQGCKWKWMAKFDDERAPAEQNTFLLMLRNYGAKNQVYDQVTFRR